MRSEDNVQNSTVPSEGTQLAQPSPGPFCLQPGHLDSVAGGGRPDFAKRTWRGDEAHASKYFMTAPMTSILGAFFGCFIGIFGNQIGGEPVAAGCVIAGAVAFPSIFVYSGLAARRESKRRRELYSRGRLLPGSVIVCHAANGYYYPSDFEAQPVPTGTYAVTLAYRFQAPTGRNLNGKESASHVALPRPLPQKGTSVVVLYLDDDHYEVL